MSSTLWSQDSASEEVTSIDHLEKRLKILECSEKVQHRKRYHKQRKIQSPSNRNRPQYFIIFIDYQKGQQLCQSLATMADSLSQRYRQNTEELVNKHAVVVSTFSYSYISYILSRWSMVKKIGPKENSSKDDRMHQVSWPESGMVLNLDFSFLFVVD